MYSIGKNGFPNRLIENVPTAQHTIIKMYTSRSFIVIEMAVGGGAS